MLVEEEDGENFWVGLCLKQRGEGRDATHTAGHRSQSTGRCESHDPVVQLQRELSERERSADGVG